MKPFKMHMIFHSDDESFVTVCGINDGASEDFWDANPLVEFGNEKETTCRNCQREYKKLLAYEESQEKELNHELKPQRIQLSRKKGWRMPENTVKVDRSTDWGNPFRVDDSLSDYPLYFLKKQAGLTNDQIQAGIITPEVSVALFRAFLPNIKALVNEARKVLAGKNLACWCKPGEPCHADVWLEEVNKP